MQLPCTILSMATDTKNIPSTLSQDEKDLLALEPPVELTDEEEKFCLLFAESHNAYGSYKEAFPDTLPQLIPRKAARLLNKRHIIQRVDHLYNKAIEPSMHILKDILETMTLRVKASPAELVQIEDGCCRYCWGTDFHYQFKTPREWKVEAEKLKRRKRKDEPPPEVPEDPPGGYGFDPYREPNEGCPECAGRGVTTYRATPTKELTRYGRALYKGVKIDRAGNVLPEMYDQHAAEEMLIRILMAVQGQKLPKEREVREAINFKDLDPQQVQATYERLRLIRLGKE